MKILKIISRNIMCFGNKTLEIDFTKDEPSIWELLGGNGVGKSTLIKIIKLGIYGKTDGLTLAEIANDVNGNGYIETHFESRNGKYKIVRTFSPASLALFENEATVATDKGGKPALEKYILNEVIDIPYYVFDNVLNLNIGDFKSFLKMKPEDARKIRDRIFSFYVLNSMVELLKVGMSGITKQMDVIMGNIANINENIEKSKEAYEQAKSKLQGDKDIKLVEYNTRLEEQQKILAGLVLQKEQTEASYKDESEKLVAVQWLMMNAEHQKLTSNVSEYGNTINALSGQKDGIENDIKIYENSARYVENINKQKELEDDEVKLNEILSVIQTNSAEKQKLDAALLIAQQNLTYAQDNTKLITDIQWLLNWYTNMTNLINSKSATKISIEAAAAQVADVEAKKLKIDEALVKYNSDIATYTKRLATFDKGICPECGANLTDDSNRRELYESELDTAKNKKDNVDKINVGAITSLSDARTLHTNLSSTLSEIQQNIRTEGNTMHTYPAHEKLAYIKQKLTMDLMSIVKNETDILPDITESINAVKPQENITPERIQELANETNTISVKLGEIGSVLTIKNNEQLSIDSKIRTTKSLLKPIEIDKDKVVSKPIDEINTYIAELRKSMNSLDNEMITKKSEKLTCENKLSEISGKLLSIEKPKYADMVLITDGDVINGNISNLKTKVSELTNSILTQQGEVNKISSDINALNELSNIEQQLTHLQTITDGHQLSLDQKNNEYEECRKQIKYYSILEYSISDSGIKAYILKDIVPAINREISSILTMLDIPLNVMFDDEFQPTITRLGKRKANIKSISVGQTKMIDFAILTAITKIIKMKYGNLNVIFYDEIFSSIEANNRTIILDIINTIFCKKLGVHVWIVNHGHMPSSYFKHILEIKSINGFSELSYVNPNDVEFVQREIASAA